MTEEDRKNHGACMVSTSIAETITAGQGELDWNGFFEFPCEECRVKYSKILEDK